MADIFISYAEADRPLALKLAAMLEAEGWKTWWDTSLTPGDDFRNEIMTELGRARAVIVIWTDTSIKSDWVRSEAGRAQGDRKLIPVKLAHLTYKDLPPPFDVLHTENIGEEDKIRAAVVAQLAKPAVEPSPWALLTKGMKYQLLTWVGIVGGALTLFGNLDAALKLADWARLLVDHWKQWTHAFWVWAFGWLGIHLPPKLTPLLTFLLFCSLLTIGQMIKFWRWPDRWAASQPIPWRQVLYIGPFVIGVYSLILIVFLDFFSESFVGHGQNVQDVVAIALGTFAMFFLYILTVRDKIHTAVAVFLLIAFWTIIIVNQLMAMKPSGSHEDIAMGALAYIMMLAFPMILFRVAPAKAVSRRLIFLGLGLLLLIALNELSKFGLDVTAPKLQG